MKYLGYALKAGAEGFQSGFNMGQMKWQQNEKKKLEKKQQELLETSSVFNNMVAQLGEDGSYSDDDMMKINTSYMALGYDVKERVDGTYKAIQAMDKKTIEQNNQWFDFVIETTNGMKSADAQVIFDTIKPFVQGEKGLQTYAALESITKKKSEITQAQPTAEVFATAEAVQEKYPGAGYEYSATAKGYVPTFQKPVTPTAPTALSAKDNWAIDAYKSGQITFDQLSKYMGTYIEPEKATALEQEIGAMKQYGATNEEIKNKLLGTGAGVTKPEQIPVPTSIENIRTDILEADTFEDAERIYKNYAQKYDEKSLMINLPKDWADTQTGYLMNIRTCVNKLLDEKGWLKKGTLTSAEVGLDFAGEQPVEEIYKKLKEEYMKYRDMLEKMGVDVSQFPKLKSLEEIEKVGLGEGFWGWGKQRGQYKSIYEGQ